MRLRNIVIFGACPTVGFFLWNRTLELLVGLDQTEAAQPDAEINKAELTFAFPLQGHLTFTCVQVPDKNAR